MPPSENGERYRFGVFELDVRAFELRKSDNPVRVRPQSLKLLSLLVARHGDVVSRDEIQQALWDRETFVDFEQGVNHGIKELRAILGDDAESPRYIQTLPRRGYRFIGIVEKIDVPEQRARRLPRWWAAVSLAGVVAVVAIVVALWRSGEAAAPAGVLSVLPFATTQVDPALGIGLANAISTRLGGQHLAAIRGATGEGRVLAGTISASGEDISVHVELKDARSEALVWSERFRVRRDELFSVEDVIAERVVAALNLRLAATEQDRLRRRYTSNAEAYQAYLRGRAALVKYTPDGTLGAIAAFEEALARDPKYALARAGLAMACADMYLRFARANEVDGWGERTEAEARAALDLDPDLAEAHLARAAVARKREFDWNATMAASRRALVLNPNLDQAHFFMAAAYYHLGYMEEALIEMQKGRGVRGADVIEPVRIEALVALFSGNFTTARVNLEEVSRLSSQPIGDTYLALAYYYSGNADRGKAMLESLVSSPSASTATRAGAALAGVLGAERDLAAARRHLARVLERDYRDHHVAYSLGAAYAQLGNIDEAQRWLHTAADTGFPCLTWFERDPLLEPLRRQPQFAELLTHVRARRESSLTRNDS